MKIAILVSLVLVSRLSFAFQYSIDEKSLLSPSSLKFHGLANIFSQAGFYPLNQNSVAGPAIPFDYLFSEPSTGKIFSLKAGLEFDPKLEGRVISDPNVKVFAFHFHYQSTAYLMISADLSEDQFRQLVKPWLKNSSVSWIKLMITEARAASCETDSSQTIFQQNQLLSQKIVSDETYRAIGKCSLDAIQAAGSKLKDQAKETLEFFKDLATDPASLWRKTKDSILQFKDFVMNIDSEIKQVFKGFESIGGLTAKEKIELACTMSGELMLTAIESLAGGIAMAKLGPVFLEKLKALMKRSSALVAKLSKLEKKGISISDKSQWAKGALACAR